MLGMPLRNLPGQKQPPREGFPASAAKEHRHLYRFAEGGHIAYWADIEPQCHSYGTGFASVQNATVIGSQSLHQDYRNSLRPGNIRQVQSSQEAICMKL